jgi:hypothetical protein
MLQLVPANQNDNFAPRVLLSALYQRLLFDSGEFGGGMSPSFTSSATSLACRCRRSHSLKFTITGATLGNTRAVRHTPQKARAIQ